MESDYVDLEKKIYLEALNNQNIYKEFLYTLFEELDSSSEDYRRVMFQRIADLIGHLNFSIKNDRGTRIIPILTSSDSDKVLLYDLIKEEFHNQELIYIPMCPREVRVLYHIYSSIIEDLGIKVLDTIELNSQKQIRSDATKALQKFQRGSDEEGLAKRWFLDDLTKEEESKLGVNSSITDDENSFEMIKSICDSSKEPIFLFIEDIELINHEYGAIDGKKTGITAEKRFLEILYEFFLEMKNILIIVPCVNSLWKELLSFTNQSFFSILDSNQLEFFDLSWLKRKIIKLMDTFWLKNAIKPPGNPFFPLDERLIEQSFDKSHGNLKKFYSLCIRALEDIVEGRRTPAEID
jgi:hypothetical protein